MAVKMTQQEVGDLFEPRVLRQTVSAWEMGTYLPTAKQLYGLCCRFGVSADYILFGLETIPVGGRLIDKIFRDRRLAEVDQPPRL